MATFGERVAELRTQRGMSQKELAGEVSRSESWVSQVERDVLSVERVPVLQALANALGVSIADLRGDDQPEAVEESATRSQMEALRLALTGHPAPVLILTNGKPRRFDIDAARERVRAVWEDQHASKYEAVSSALVPLLEDLEHARRTAPEEQTPEIASILADAYQIAAASFARLDESDAAWIAADRSLAVAEFAREPLKAMAGHFRMAHAFLSLRRLDQAEAVAQRGIEALLPVADTPEARSVLGALFLVLAVAQGRSGDRSGARSSLAQAEKVAAKNGQDRNDFDTEFGPTNVQLHAVAVAVDLGDAGEALDVASHVDASVLSPERQARFFIDVARAHGQRRQTGDAIAALLKSEAAAPERLYNSSQARELIRDLAALSGRRQSDELVALVRRAAAGE